MEVNMRRRSGTRMDIRVNQGPLTDVDHEYGGGESRVAIGQMTSELNGWNEIA